VTEQRTPTANWVQGDDGSWTPTREPVSVYPTGVRATPAPVVSFQDFRPTVAGNEGDYWLRPATGPDMAYSDILTNTGRWYNPGFGYPGMSAFTAVGAGMQLTAASDGSFGAAAHTFLDNRVYRAEWTVNASGPAHQVRVVWAFTRDSGLIVLTPGVDTVIGMDIPWHAGNNNGVGLQVADGSLGGTFVIKSAKMFDVTDSRAEQYVFDSEHGWTLIGDGVGTPAGVLQVYAGISLPAGWLWCDGASLVRASYPVLFAAFGTTYGAADGTHFNLPDLRGKVPVGQQAASSEFVTLGQTGGEKSHVLSAGEMPSHNHSWSGVNHAAVRSGSAGNYPFSIQEDEANNWTGTQSLMGLTGGGGAHNNLQPYLTINYIVKAG
jgi:microcystin-dependent protein